MDFWTITGWLIALLSLIVNALQLRKNRELNNKLSNTANTSGKNSPVNQQTSSGTGDNLMSGRDINIGEK